MERISKYPRTRHVEGSRLQPGDEDLGQVAWSSLAGKHLVVEEKFDGANAGVSFTAAGELRLQRAVLRASPVVSVPVLRRGSGRDLPPPAAMVGRSLYKSPSWRQRLRDEAEREGLDVERAVAETDPGDDAEGLYLKVEAGGRVRQQSQTLYSSASPRCPAESNRLTLCRPRL